MWASEIAGSRLMIAPKLSHMLCTEAPAVFNKLVMDFLDRQPR